MRINHQTRIRPNESGMVAIVVSMVIIMVLSLIVLAFARISQKEQRQVLDRQLNIQAFYAAEAGVNDARDALKSGAPALLNEDGNNCTPPMPAGYNSNIDGTNNVRYTCLLIDTTPISIEFNSVSSGESKIVPIEGKTGGRINQLAIYWEDAGNGQTFSGCPSNAHDPLPSNWHANCSPGIIRLDLVPFGTPKSRDNFINQTATKFAIPTNSGGAGSIDYPSIIGFGNTGGKVGVGCTAVTSSNYPRNCKLLINGLNENRYYLRLTSLYRTSAISLCFPDCGSTARETTRAQALVDSTGLANDVLRRMQVRIPLSDLFNQDLYGPFPGYAIESGNDICKRISLAPPLIFDECGLLPSGGSPTGGGADAEVVSCTQVPPTDPNYCSGSGNTKHSYFRWYYAVNLINISKPPDGATAVSCTWDWQDGTTSSTACNENQKISHCFISSTPYPPYSPKSTSKKIINLKVNYSNGETGETNYSTYRPYRTEYWNDASTQSCSIVETDGYEP